jgi:hypothetical protein
LPDAEPLMSTATPLIFRPSLAQRSLTGLLFAGSWIMGIRLLVLLIHNLPRMHAALRLAQVSEEPTLWLWVSLAASITACVLGGILLVLSLTAMLLVEGTQVFVDEMGIAVECLAVPRRFARWLGAGRLTWKEIHTLEKHRLFFELRSGGEDASNATSIRVANRPPVLRFLLVDELERLVLMILERSPNLRFKE